MCFYRRLSGRKVAQPFSLRPFVDKVYATTKKSHQFFLIYKEGGRLGFLKIYKGGVDEKKKKKKGWKPLI